MAKRHQHIEQEKGGFQVMCPFHPDKEALPQCFVRFPQALETMANDEAAGYKEDKDRGISTGAVCCFRLYPEVGHDGIRDT